MPQPDPDFSLTPPAPSSTRTRPLHALVWLMWAIAGGACVQIAPNPIYATIVLAIAWLSVEACSPPGPLRRAFPLLLGLGAFFGLLRVGLTVLTTHGVGTVWFSIPEFTLPRIIGGFTVGGAIEAPVVLQALAESYAIVVMIGVFGAFNACVSHAQLVRSAPRAFHELGLVVTIAVAFVPSTIAALHAVREADRSRTGGTVVRRGRIRRLTVPVLERGLEQAISLSESMDSRGFARERGTRASVASSWCGLACLIALTGGFVALVGRSNAMAVTLLMVGAVALVFAIVLANRAAPVRHRTTRLTRRDWLVAAIVALAPLTMIGLTVTDDTTLIWNAWRMEAPAISVVGVVGLLPLLAPVVAGFGRATITSPGFAEVDA